MLGDKISAGLGRDWSNWPEVVRLDEAFRENAPAFRAVVRKAWTEFGIAWAEQVTPVLRTVLPGESLGAAVRGYGRFSAESMRAQRKFEMSRRYVVTTHAECERAVYGNAEYMQTEYLPGLLLSHYLWPHHIRQLAFFSSAFADRCAERGDIEFYEVAVGTGTYSRVLLQRAPEAVGVGLDISSASNLAAETQVAAFGLSVRYRSELRDALCAKLPPVDALVCVELLEHLDDPTVGLRALRRLLKPGGIGFITAAMNAAHADHVFLYEGPEQVGRDIEVAGFKILEGYWAPAYQTHADVPRPGVAAFIVS
jgi:SAM-dependent methyltransferase